ncbi:hypothetical protein RhiJN_21541 [Ceratobasidium sp. AG-Ba]|nr:hypothetical protein RhiJN_21541 [Ceratobasidium sp. AG-Ba]
MPNLDPNDVDRVHHKLSAVIELLLTLLPEEIQIVDNRPEDKHAELAKNVAGLIDKLALNQTALVHLTRVGTAKRLLGLLAHQNLRTNRPSLATQFARTLSRLTSYLPCATEICKDKRYSPLIDYVMNHQEVKDKQQSRALLNEVLSILVHMRESAPEFLDILTPEMLQQLVSVLQEDKHPASRNALRLVEAVSIYRPHLIFLSDTDLTEILYKSIKIYPEAPSTLANLIAHGNLGPKFFGEKNQEAIIEVLQGKDSDLIKATLALVEALARQERLNIEGASQDKIDVNKVSKAIVVPLGSGISELAERALDATIQLTLNFDHVNEDLLEILDELTFGGRNRKAVLALAGTIHSAKEYSKWLEGPLISALVDMMEDEDNTLAEGAIKVISRFMHEGYGIDDMYYLGGVKTLGQVLRLALDPIAYIFPHTLNGRTRITLAAFDMIKTLAANERTKEDIIRYDIINKVVLLTDSPRTYDIDDAAAKLLMGLESIDGHLATIIKKCIDENGRSENETTKYAALDMFNPAVQTAPDTA